MQLDKHGMVPSRFSRDAFSGDEGAASAALTAHEAALLPGSRVRVYRGQQTGLVGVVEDRQAPGSRCVAVRDADGLGWSIESRNLEVVS